MNIKHFLLIATKIVLAMITSLLLLSVFTYFYKYTPEKIVNRSHATDFVYMPNGRISNYKEGYATFYIDDNGFNNSHIKASSQKPDVLLMGSSHMFGSEVSPEENVSYIMNDLLEDKSVYNIGMASHDFGVCLRNVENAINVFNPQHTLIIETSSVVIDAQIINEINLADSSLKVYTNPIVGLVQKVFPSVKRLLLDIETWINMDSKTDIRSDKQTEDGKIELYNLALGSLKSKVNNRVNIIIVYHPILSIDSRGEYEQDPNMSSVKLFEEACNNNGISFLNMNECFEHNYKRYHILPHGFSNSEIGKGHLNKYGHLWMAEELTQLILEEQ